ncbi:MAG: 50S ribosomal protein L22 [Gemmatimonadetes bacterium]|nr:50S ribosomal protein L22 [Gemmatimonadota bacterium]
MEATAKAMHVRIGARKMRLVVDLIRGRSVEDALMILQGTQKKASPIVEKLLRSAVANALYVGEEEEETAHRPNIDDLIVKKAWVDGGPIMKRFRPRPMGRANRIRKRTSHLTIVVGTKVSQRRAR